jgi:hypothetical protein
MQPSIDATSADSLPAPSLRAEGGSMLVGQMMVTFPCHRIGEEYRGSPALDAGLLAAAQAVEHYEISRYGTLIAAKAPLIV